MAQIELEPGRWFGRPYCPGCGETFQGFGPWIIDSNIRGPYGPDARRRGSKALEVAAFAERHRACAEPLRSITATGIPVVDRRRFTAEGEG